MWKHLKEPPLWQTCRVLAHGHSFVRLWDNFFSHTDSTNRVFNMTIDTGSRSPLVTFQFLNGPVTSATCTVQYGADPTYLNLQNTDSFTGTNTTNVAVPLSAPLQADTLYYCLVFSIGVQMQGTFRLGMVI